MREYFDKSRRGLLPVVEQPLGSWTPRQLQVPHDQSLHDLHVVRIEQWLQIDRLQVAALLGEVSALVEDVRHTATHAGGKIPATGSQHQHQAIGHVLATVVANALDNCCRSGISNRKAFACDPVEEGFATGRAI